MEITYDDFVAACPSAIMPDRSVFDSLGSFIAGHRLFVQGIITMPVFVAAEEAVADTENPHSDRLLALQGAIKNYISVAAYADAVPHLDLVLTATGFGVVSNQNVAPASADRVRELRVTLDRQMADYFDRLVDLARPLVDWTQSLAGRNIFSTLFWRGSQIVAFGIARPTRRDLAERRPEIDDAARAFCRTLSPELYQALLLAESRDSATPMQGALIAMWRAATVAWSRHNGSYLRHVEAMLNFVEVNIDEFPEYRESQTYAANHIERYENKKDDSCFFFG